MKVICPNCSTLLDENEVYLYVEKDIQYAICPECGGWFKFDKQSEKVADDDEHIQI